MEQEAGRAALGLEQYEQQRSQQAGMAAVSGIAAGTQALTAGSKAAADVEAAKYQAQAAKYQAEAAKAATPKQSARGGKIEGREIPGKAKFKGDTRSNDTVPALLSPGEIVLPRTVAQAEDAPEKAKKFVDAIKKQKRPSPKAFAQALARLNELEARLNAMETLADLEAEEEG
jgi:membrane protease subunit (stomatin/prohibitin family)